MEGEVARFVVIFEVRTPGFWRPLPRIRTPPGTRELSVHPLIEPFRTQNPWRVRYLELLVLPSLRFRHFVFTFRRLGSATFSEHSRNFSTIFGDRDAEEEAEEAKVFLANIMEDIFRKYEEGRQARIKRGTYCSDLSIVFSNLHQNILETRDLTNYNTPQNCRDRLKKVKNVLPLASTATPTTTLSTTIRYPNARPHKLDFESEVGEGGDEGDKEDKPPRRSPQSSIQQDGPANSPNLQHQPANSPNLQYQEEVIDPDQNPTYNAATVAGENKDEKNGANDEADTNSMDCVEIIGISTLEFDPNIELRYELYDYSCLSKKLRTCFFGIVKTIYQKEMRIQKRLPLFKKIRIKENNSSNSYPNKDSLLLKDIDFYFEHSQIWNFTRNFKFNWINKERCHDASQRDPVKNSVEHSVDHVVGWAQGAGDNSRVVDSANPADPIVSSSSSL